MLDVLTNERLSDMMPISKSGHIRANLPLGQYW